MAKTTYILGAGASYDALPTGENFNTKLEETIFSAKHLLTDVAQKRATNEWINAAQTSIKDLEDLLAGCSDESSPDTYAKKLFIRKDFEKYRITKCSIILFFELYKLINNTRDKRYSAFIATILDNTNSDPYIFSNTPKSKLPPTISIISWNYDFEFEKAYMDYMNNCNDIHDVYSELNVIHKNGSSKFSHLQSFDIIKVNGTAGYFINDKISLGLPIDVSPNANQETKFAAIIDTHYKNTHSRHWPTPALSFAWEPENEAGKLNQYIRNTLQETTNLVVIGYSFPYFNRIIDKYIMSNFHSNYNTSIFIQDEKPETIEEEINDVKAFPSGTFYYKRNLKKFFIPDGILS